MTDYAKTVYQVPPPHEFVDGKLIIDYSEKSALLIVHPEEGRAHSAELSKFAKFGTNFTFNGERTPGWIVSKTANGGKNLSAAASWACAHHPVDQATPQPAATKITTLEQLKAAMSGGAAQPPPPAAAAVKTTYADRVLPTKGLSLATTKALFMSLDDVDLQIDRSESTNEQMVRGPEAEVTQYLESLGSFRIVFELVSARTRTVIINVD